MPVLRFLDSAVAPLAGAWIEIHVNCVMTTNPFPVAPLAGAWIEMSYTPPQGRCSSVAPLAGAWIEIGK